MGRRVKKKREEQGGLGSNAEEKRRAGRTKVRPYIDAYIDPYTEPERIKAEETELAGGSSKPQLPNWLSHSPFDRIAPLYLCRGAL